MVWLYMFGYICFELRENAAIQLILVFGFENLIQPNPNESKHLIKLYWIGSVVSFACLDSEHHNLYRAKLIVLQIYYRLDIINVFSLYYASDYYYWGCN